MGLPLHLQVLSGLGGQVLYFFLNYKAPGYYFDRLWLDGSTGSQATSLSKGLDTSLPRYNSRPGTVTGSGLEAEFFIIAAGACIYQFYNLQLLDKYLLPAFLGSIPFGLVGDMEAGDQAVPFLSKDG